MNSSPAAPVFRLLLLISLLLARADALLLSGDGPSSRRAKLSEWARLAAGGIAVASSAVALASHPKLKQWGGGPELSLYSDDLATARQLAALQSSNDMAPSRRRLEAEWAELRTRRVSRAEAEAAFATVLRARKAVAAAEAAVRDSRWAAVDAALPLRIVGELETAATVLARSPLVDSDGRRDIGWQWGACGYRRCGAQADAAQALFYLDVAKRAIDEIVSVGANAGLGRGAALPRRTPDAYLPPETLDTILVDELLSPLEQPVYKQRPGEGGDGSDEVEAALAAYEASMMEYLEKEMGKGASND